MKGSVIPVDSGEVGGAPGGCQIERALGLLQSPLSFAVCAFGFLRALASAHNRTICVAQLFGGTVSPLHRTFELAGRTLGLATRLPLGLARCL